MFETFDQLKNSINWRKFAFQRRLNAATRSRTDTNFEEQEGIFPQKGRKGLLTVAQGQYRSSHIRF